MNSAINCSDVIFKSKLGGRPIKVKNMTINHMCSVMRYIEAVEPENYNFWKNILKTEIISRKVTLTDEIRNYFFD